MAGELQSPDDSAPRSLVERVAGGLLIAQSGAAAAFLVIIIGCVLGQFVGRSLFGLGLHWAGEASRFAFVWCALLGTAAAWQAGALHRVDLLLRQLPERARLAGELSALLLAGLALFYLLYHGVIITQRVAHQTSSTMNISMAWVYAAAPCTAALMLLSTLLTLPQRLRRVPD